VRAPPAAELGLGSPHPPAAGMLVACGMRRCHQEALKRNRVLLAKQLVLKELVEHLVEKDIVTAEMVETIQVAPVTLGCTIGFVAGGARWRPWQWWNLSMCYLVF